ncbi:MAG: hypothetical protein AAFU55_05675 [Pseudomonadota bacterium]
MSDESKRVPVRPLLIKLGKQTGKLAASNRSFLVAAILSLIWLGGVIAYAAGFFGLFEAALLTPRTASALEIALFILAGLAPITLFFYGALLARKAEEIRSETARLSSAIDALRVSVSPRSTPGANELAQALTTATRSSLAEEKAAMAEAMDRLDAALAETQSMVDKLEGRESQARRAAKTVSGPKRLSDGEQPVLPFGATTDIDREGRPIPWQNVVRALDFPKDEKDVDGFAALRQVVADKEIADLLQASEDTLTFLAEEGLYMEDLKPQVAPIQTWLRYAEGARGAEVAALGGITDEVAVAISRGRLKRDAVFRDTALHFLRRFDALIERMARELGEDAMILEMGDTRTGRAFMLTARISGAFD